MSNAFNPYQAKVEKLLKENEQLTQENAAVTPSPHHHRTITAPLFFVFAAPEALDDAAKAGELGDLKAQMRTMQVVYGVVMW